MEYRQLYYFVCVAKEGNFTRAAEKLMISEPSLSKAIKRLEEELGGSSGNQKFQIFYTD